MHACRDLRAKCLTRRLAYMHLAWNDTRQVQPVSPSQPISRQQSTQPWAAQELLEIPLFCTKHFTAEQFPSRPLSPNKTSKATSQATMSTDKDWKEELDDFGRRLKQRKALEKYAPWHPRNVVLHPTRTFRLAFGFVGDDEMEKALAHMESGTAGSKDKPRPKPKQKKRVRSIELF